MLTTRPTLPWPENCTVSGLMVIDRTPLLDFARIAQDCFYAQDWPRKQLVVLNSTGVPLNRWWRHRSTKELRLRSMPRPEALRLLNDNADGEWCATWDADCWYAPTVLSLHMSAAERETAVLFRNTTAYSVSERKAYTISDERIVHGSWLRLNRFNWSLPFYSQTRRLKYIDAPAQLVIKFVSHLYADKST